MQVYLYAKSGHNFGLENVRRVSSLVNVFKDTDPILCTADYRAATFAKSELGVNRGVGVDVIGNLNTFADGQDSQLTKMILKKYPIKYLEKLKQYSQYAMRNDCLVNFNIWD